MQGLISFWCKTKTNNFIANLFIKINAVGRFIASNMMSKTREQGG